MARSPAHEPCQPDFAASAGAHRAAAGLHRNAAGADRRQPRTPGAGAAHRPGVGLPRPAAGAQACTRRTWRRTARVSRRRLAGAVRHRAGGRPAVGPDAGAHAGGRAAGAAVCERRLGQSRPAFSCADPVSADGSVRRLRHRRPVQPVRVFRSAADRLLRAAGARPGQGALPRRRAVRGDQSRRIGAVPDRCVTDLRRDRHAQHGRSGAARAAGHR